MADSKVRAVFLSITAPLRAIPYLLVRPALLGLAVVPVVITALVLVGMFFFFRDLFPFDDTADHFADAQGFWNQFLAYLLTLSGIAFPLLLSAMVGYLLAAPIAAPFNDRISELIEREELRDHPTLLPAPLPWKESLFNLVRDVLQRFLIAVPLTFGAIALSIFPVIGPLAATLLTFFTTGFFYAVDSFSFSLDRRRMSLLQKLRWLSARRRLSVPFGITLGLLLTIPCNVLWLPTVATVAATRMLCRRLIEEELA